MTSAPDTRLVRKAALRLGAQAAALVAVTVLALIALATVVVLHAQHTGSQNLLRAATATADDVADPPAGVWLTIQGRAGVRSSAGLPPGLPVTADLDAVQKSGSTIEREVRVNGRDFRVLTTVARVGVVQADLDLHADHEETGRLVSALLVGGLTGLGLAVLVGSLLGRRAVRPLSDALEMQRRFVADASHELRTPLTLLSTRAQLVERALAAADPSSALSSDAAGVVSDARHLAGILEDLLTAADPREPSAPVDIRALLDAVADSSADYAREQGVTLTVEAAELHLAASGQEAALRRALTALVDNAIHHSPHGGSVWLSCRAGAHRTVRLDVTDEGSGVDPARRDELVRRFHSESAPGTRRYGLGLALADEVAARHGGHLEIMPGRSGRGSCFSLSIPASTRRDH